MKKLLIFLGGFVAGILATFLFGYLIVLKDKPDNGLTGLNIFRKRGECITKKQLKIFQTIKPNMALAEFGEFPDETLVLLINYENEAYYDKQKIKVPVNKCARQIGTYQFETKMEMNKTVPVVIIE